MSKSTIWYGFLDAGAKSTAVVIDERLNTGNPNTIYVFNFARGKILEYKREIAETKLREFRAEESAVLQELQSAFDRARREFRTRGASILNLPERGNPKKARAKDEEMDIEDDDNFDDFDLELGTTEDESVDELEEIEEM